MGPFTSTRPTERQALRNAKKAQKKSGKNNKLGSVQLSVDDLIQAAEHALNSGTDPMQSVSLYTVALKRIEQKLQPSAEETKRILDILEKRAELYVIISSQEKALEDYQAALHLLPEVDIDNPDAPELLERRASYHMNIGQLLEGKDALSSFQHGIECLSQVVILRRKLSEKVSKPDATAELYMNDKEGDGTEISVQRKNHLHETKRKLAQANCAVSELFMTDLCFEENAEQQCEFHIQQALQYSDEENSKEPCVDALQIAASHRLSQSRALEAADFILRAFDKMKVGCQALSSIVGLRETGEVVGGSMELVNVEEVQSLPSFDFRCQTAKILIECASLLRDEEYGNKQSQCDDHKIAKSVQDIHPLFGQCTENAMDVLGSLMAENDEIVEVWSLLGDTFSLKADGACDIDEKKTNIESSIHYWKRAVEILENIQRSLGIEQQHACGQDEDDEIQQHLDEILCQLDEVRTKLDNVENVEPEPMEE